MPKAMTSEWTEYSDEVDGDDGNHKAAARFDWTGGYVGISMKDAATGTWCDRVLLTPSQVVALKQFVRDMRASPEEER